jgi:hypothetical protein
MILIFPLGSFSLSHGDDIYSQIPKINLLLKFADLN